MALDRTPKVRVQPGKPHAYAVKLGRRIVRGGYRRLILIEKFRTSGVVVRVHVRPQTAGPVESEGIPVSKVIDR